MNLKVKMFYFSADRVSETETAINEWLDGMKHIEVLHMAQSSTDYYSKGSRRSTYITILYKENFER